MQTKANHIKTNVFLSDLSLDWLVWLVWLVLGIANRGRKNTRTTLLFVI